MTVDQGIKDLITRLGAVIKERGVPAGGTTGQVLSKSSATNYATAWIDPATGGGSNSISSEPHVEIPVGRWLNPGLTANSPSTQAATASRLYLVPFVVVRDRNIDQLGCTVSTASTGSIRMGLYNSDATTGMPTTVFIDPGGTLPSSGTTGGKSQAAVTTLIAGTQYWTAFVCSAAATFTAMTAAEMWPIGGGVSQSNAGSNYAYTTHTATNALPNLTGVSLTWAGAAVPLVAVRIAA